MANLGNAWHIPASPEVRGRGGMRDPIGAIVPGTAITIFSGNQFQGGGGNPGNQLQIGSSIFFKRAADANWKPLPLTFQNATGNNKYYAATIPAGTFQPGDVVQYYLRIAYSDHATTFLGGQNNASIATGDEAAARAAPFTFPVESSASKGQWGPVFQLPNVGIHAHVLPNGLVLMWGRRVKGNPSLDVQACTPFLWNPVSGVLTDAPQPTLANGTKVNLFCSGHTFLPDGRLLVAGGHLTDGDGVNQAALYDSKTNTWTATALMNFGRWYPTATSLPDGRVVVLAGSHHDNATGNSPHDNIPQAWQNGAWTALADFAPNGTLELYPRTHVASDGRVFMSGPLAQTYLLDTSSGGRWTAVAQRVNGQRDYCPSVIYDVDKVIYIGGGGGNGVAPTPNAELVDLSRTPVQWQATNPMHFGRRMHHATLLADGTVLVTGGTRGGDPDPNLNGRDNGFNDLGPGKPVHIAELWDPASGTWTQLAAEQVDRCYHATAVLLPDATVLSAGGGEYRPVEADPTPNAPEDSHSDGQIFSPPYLFKGNRPDITSAPVSVQYGATFQVGTSQPSEIGKVTWIRLSSTTHAFNLNQRINFLQFQAGAGTLTVTAPSSPNLCPPGHYMLFVLSKAGVPSVARIMQIAAAAVPAPVAAAAPAAELVSPGAPVSAGGPFVEVLARRPVLAEAARGTPVVVGISGTCPYGIAACWGGAHETLLHLEAVDLVDPLPDAQDSTAQLFLEDDRLPPLDRWQAQFQSMVSGRYVLRGVEVTLQGAIEERAGQLFIAGTGQRPAVQLAPLAAGEKIQWDRPAGAPKPLEAGESVAFDRLAVAARDLPAARSVTVTGPLEQVEAGFRMHVRVFTV